MAQWFVLSTKIPMNHCFVVETGNKKTVPYLNSSKSNTELTLSIGITVVDGNTH